MPSKIDATEVSDKGYSQVITLRAEGPINLAFISGQVARDADGNIVGENDFERQCRFIFDELERHLESVGSSLERVLKVTVFLTDFSNYGTLVDIRKSYFSPDSPPASTAVAVKSLVDPLLLLEIEAIALVP